MSKDLTIKELARQLGLSVATVSKALRDSHEISQATKQRVQELATQLDYVPDPYASSLRSRKSKTLAVVVPEIADSFFSQAINGIESVAIEKGYHVLIYLTHERYESEKAILHECQSGRVEGILISVTANTLESNHIDSILRHNIPLVFFDRCIESVDCPKVTTNDFESAYQATEHLIAAGCRNIAILSISGNLSISNQRFLGYRKALEEHGIPFDPANDIQCSATESDNYALVKTVLNRSRRPDAFIASVEKLTASVYLACRDLNLSIPGDVKMLCFSNLDTAMILNPALTTVTQPAYEIGREAAQILFRALGGKRSFRPASDKIIIPSRLMIRESTQL